MELDELRERWRALDGKLDRALAVEAELLRQAVVPAARRRVDRLAIGPALDAALGIGGAIAVAAFLGRHGRDAGLAAPAAVLLAGLVALGAGGVRQLDRIARLDWSGPVAGIQAALADLRRVRIRQFRWVILLSPLMGFCALVVGLQAAAGGGGRVLDRLDPRWVAANYAFGVLFVPLGALAARALARRGRGRAWWRAVLEDVAGASLERAARDVDRWARLVQEGSGPDPKVGSIDGRPTA